MTDMDENRYPPVETTPGEEAYYAAEAERMTDAYKVRGRMIPLLGILTSLSFCLLIPAWYGGLAERFTPIAALVVGGGLAMLPVIEETFVNRKKILSSDELLDMISLTQTVPGIIAVNSAVYVGWKVAGFFGALCAVTGVILPSFLVILCIAMLFPHLSPDNIYVKGAFAGVRSCWTVRTVSGFRKTLPPLPE